MEKVKKNIFPSKTPCNAKASTPDLKNNYFLNLEDNPKSRQDHLKTTLEVIGVPARRTMEHSRDLSLFFYKLESHTLTIPSEPIPNPTT